MKCKEYNIMQVMKVAQKMLKKNQKNFESWSISQFTVEIYIVW